MQDASVTPNRSPSRDFRVNRTTSLASLAGAIAHRLREEPTLTVLATGVPAITNTARAIALAGRFLLEAEYRIDAVLSFTEYVREDGVDIQGLSFRLTRHAL